MSSNGSICSFRNDDLPQDDENNFTSHPTVKCEDEENDPKCDPSFEFMDVNAGFPPYPVKTEPEDLKDDFQFHPENVAIKTEPEDLKYDFQFHPENVAIKTEPEDPLYDDVQLQAKNVAWKDETNIKDRTGWELTVTSSSRIFELHPVQNCQLQSSATESEEKGNYFCAFCPYKTNTKSEYVQHYACNHLRQKIKMYKCTECSFETKSKRNLAAHYKHKHSTEDAEVYKCEECSFETKYKRSLYVHYKCTHAVDAEIYKCKECSYETRKKCHLNQHFKCIHSKEAEVYRCQECPYETRYKGNVTKHYKCKHTKQTEVFSD